VVAESLVNPSCKRAASGFSLGLMVQILADLVIGSATGAVTVMGKLMQARNKNKNHTIPPDGV
jgi:hypothetical protein